jgi:hypothetical protein
MQSLFVTWPVDRSSSEMLVDAKSLLTTTRPAPGVSTVPDPVSVPLSGGGGPASGVRNALSPQAPHRSAAASSEARDSE